MVKIGVVGSISTDFVVEASTRPQQGETIFGEGFGTSFGGKGANQAVASARLGASVSMIGAVGDDTFGSGLIENLQKEGIETRFVEKVSGVPSGAAVITLVAGDNSIIYVAGANNEVSPDQIAEIAWKQFDIVLVQNETPQVTIEKLINECHKVGTQIILNPAPARTLSEGYIEKVDYLTPNETEFNVLFPGEKMEDVLKKYPNKLIITLGAQGAIFYDGDVIQEVPAVEVAEIIDTTGAGDTFNGALAFSLASGNSLIESVRFANLAGSLSITKKGAQSGMPTMAEMELHKAFKNLRGEK